MIIVGLPLPLVPLKSLYFGPLKYFSVFSFFVSGKYLVNSTQNFQSLLTRWQKVNVVVWLPMLLGQFTWKRLIKCSQPLLYVNSSTDDINQAQPTAPTQSLEVQSVPSKWKCLLWWFGSSHVISECPREFFRKRREKISLYATCLAPDGSQAGKVVGSLWVNKAKRSATSATATNKEHVQV